MINRNPLLAFALTVVMAVYLAFSLPVTAEMARNDTFAGCHINVADSMSSGFVSQLEVSRECDDIMQWITTRKRGEVDLQALENTLRACDKIEDVNVNVLNNGLLNIDVIPMVPVARVFDNNTSYYINAVGKRISADPRYHIDVPVVVGYFPAERPAVNLLPLLHYISSDPTLDALVSTVKQDRNGDITIVPSIRGHVINFGDTSLVADKFSRIEAFYKNVMPVRGWETYDTVAVKWRGRVVATRRNKALPDSHLSAVLEEYDDIDDHETMITPLHGDSAAHVQR